MLTLRLYVQNEAGGSVMANDRMTDEYRRFLPIGGQKEMDKLNALVEEKNLSRMDLYTILTALKINPAFDGQEDTFQ